MDLRVAKGKLALLVIVAQFLSTYYYNIITHLGRWTEFGLRAKKDGRHHWVVVPSVLPQIEGCDPDITGVPRGGGTPRRLSGGRRRHPAETGRIHPEHRQ